MRYSSPGMQPAMSAGTAGGYFQPPLPTCWGLMHTSLCPQVKTEGGKIIRVEAHPIPEHPRPRRAQGRVALVGDAAGYVTKCSGEGIYFAAKSGRMCAEAIVEASQNGQHTDNQHCHSFTSQQDALGEGDDTPFDSVACFSTVASLIMHQG